MIRKQLAASFQRGGYRYFDPSCRVVSLCDSCERLRGADGRVQQQSAWR